MGDAVRLLLPVLLSILLCPLARAEAPVVAEARQALADGAARLAAGDLRGAEGALEQARTLADEAGEAAMAVEVRLHLGELFARSGRLSRGVAAVAEGIALADGLEARGESPAGPSVAVRVQLAEMLRAHGALEDSEAAAWDALGRAVSLQAIELTGPAIRLIVLDALSLGADAAALQSLVAELDLALSGLDAYRLALPPPPEPIVVGLEALGRQLIEAGQAELAVETLLAVAALDASRDAAFRLPTDLARVATAAVQAGNAATGRWASELARVLQGREPSADVLSAVCEVALLEERHRDAAKACHQGAQRAQGFVRAALLARTADAWERAGELAPAEKLRKEAQAGFEAAGAKGDALVERAALAWVLVRRGRYEAASREMLAAVAGSDQTGAAPRVEELRLRVALEEVRAGRVEAASATAVLEEVGKWLFEQRRIDDLAGLAAFHAWRDLEAGRLDQALEAAEHAVQFERDLGLADEGWRALEVRAAVHARAGRAQEAAADRSELRTRWSHTAPPRAARHDDFFEDDFADAMRRILTEEGAEGPDVRRELLAADDLRRTLGKPRPISDAERALVDAEATVDSIRAAIRRVSLQGGERAPAEVRAELLPELVAARQARDRVRVRVVEELPIRSQLWGAPPMISTSKKPQRELVIAGRCNADGTALVTAPPAGTAVEQVLAAARGELPDDGLLTLNELIHSDVLGASVTWTECKADPGRIRLALLAAGAVRVVVP